MIDFKEIVGHTKPKQILKNRIKNEKIGHSYLFVGNEGIGKKLTAIAFSKAINCKNISEEQDPCNKCSSCQQIEKNSSADFSIISPVDSVIKIEKIREIKSNIYLHPLTNKKKIYIFDNAEKMTTQASNSLLKILEEPPEYAILI
ncbi:MAG: DNA polymerase III subunit delta', partial [Atribacterota bacterium]|nr:DNA polymerase III subunit delta' [Atribacterota bacterium]